MSNSILVIRGGAIGDFVLTLPALRLLREGFPQSRIEIIGYRHICELANGRFYADAVRSIEYGPMAGFFNPKADLDSELGDYFAGFGQIISYLFDPDGFFAGNLGRVGVRNLITGDPRIRGDEHASRQLARPLERLALFLEDTTADFHPKEADQAAADEVLPRTEPGWVAVHPGSGSPKKNWPVEHWIRLLHKWLDEGRRVLVVGGESDEEAMGRLSAEFGGCVKFAVQLPLCTLATALGRCSFFVGHDSGISHLAALAGVPSLLLFGPTDPAIWAPERAGISVLDAPGRNLRRLTVDAVDAAVRARLEALA